MAWVTIVEANSLEEFKTATPTVAELPKGTKIKLRLELKAPVGNLITLFPASWWASKLLPEGIVVTDVKGGWWWLEVYGEIDPPMPSVWAIAALVAAIALLGFAITSLIKVIKLDGDLPVPTPIPSIPGWLIFVGLIAILLAYRKPIIGEIERIRKTEKLEEVKA